MFRVRIQVGCLGGGGKAWEEELDVKSLETAEAEAKRVIDEFNAEEIRRYGSDAPQREFREMVRSVGQLHDWHKVNLVTNSDMTDTWQCSVCHATTKTKMSRPEASFGGFCEVRLGKG